MQSACTFSPPWVGITLYLDIKINTYTALYRDWNITVDFSELSKFNLLTEFFQDQFQETWATFGTSYHGQHRQRWDKVVFQYQDSSRSFVVWQVNNQENIYKYVLNLLGYKYVRNHLVDCWNPCCKLRWMFLVRQTWSRLRIGFELKLSKLNEFSRCLTHQNMNHLKPCLQHHVVFH